MTIRKVSTLLTTNWLKEQIGRACNPSSGKMKLERTLRVLDTSWMPQPEMDGYRLFYKEGHIPSALHFDLKRVQTPGQTGPGSRYLIPDSNLFQDYVEDLGISNDTHVVAYDRFTSVSSLRTWMIFRLFGHDRVSVLNGGLMQWLRDGFPVTTEELSVEKGEFHVKFRPEMLKDFVDMQNNIKTKSWQVMDSRGQGSFAGETEKDGHIPGSKNIPFKALFNEDGTVKSQDSLKLLFDDAGIDLSKPLVSTCQTAMTACGLIAAAHILGKEDVSLYNGSFTEWSQLADSSMIARQGNEGP